MTISPALLYRYDCHRPLKKPPNRERRRDMQKQELQMGYMSNEQLAAWFGVAKDTLRKKKKLMLPKLESFADFDIVHGGINITKIYCKVYGADVYPRIKELLPEY